MIRRLALALLTCGLVQGATTAGQEAKQAPATAREAIDRDLLDVTVARLHRLYADRKYTVTQVVQWHLDRIDRYNGVYGAIETVLRKSALTEAARQDAEAARGDPAAHRALWGVPIVIKANTSVAGQITTAGWEGFTTPGHELVAPRDATIVAKLKTAGAIVVGLANMPDLANSDTNRSSSYGRTGNAYDVRFSPGGSSGGVVTAVAANMAVLGNGTDTGNSIRMPAATSALVGVYPTRGLVSIAGIAPLDWLLDYTGPIARTVEDASIALEVMSGPDPLDPRTAEAPPSAQRPPYTPSLPAGTLKGKRFGVPAFVLAGEGVPFHGIPARVGEEAAEKLRKDAAIPLRPETRALFMQAGKALHDAGAEVVFDENLLAAAFARTASRVATYAYMRDGTDRFLAAFGPPEYTSAAAYEKALGKPLFVSSIGVEDHYRAIGGVRIEQRVLDRDRDAERMYHAPKRATLAAYLEPLDRLKLDGYVYPAIQMPPPDETMPQDGALSSGPHSNTSWVNMIGVPAVVVSAGAYPNGLPFGLEFSGRPWTDDDLLAIAAAWERTTSARPKPVLVEHGLLPVTPAREEWTGGRGNPAPPPAAAGLRSLHLRFNDDFVFVETSGNDVRVRAVHLGQASDWCPSLMVLAEEKIIPATTVAKLAKSRVCTLDAGQVERAHERAPDRQSYTDFMGSYEEVIADCGGAERAFERRQPPIVDDDRLKRQSPDVAGLWELLPRFRALAAGTDDHYTFYRATEAVRARRSALGTALVSALRESRYGSYLSVRLYGYTGPRVDPGPHPEILDRAKLPLIHGTTPVFPVIALSARIFGDVRLRLALDPASGQVTGVTVVDGKPFIRDASVDAVKQWRFDPAAGLPPVMDVTIRFQLDCD
jgi:Asp-tRNA(Asn)/Glu-tRNA(Gln) amidotransferase A subunit family amidase